MSKKKKGAERVSLWKSMTAPIEDAVETRILLHGRGELMVDGARRIEHCTEEHMAVRLRRERFDIYGCGLICRSFRNGVLVIGGRIDSLSFEKGGGQ